MKSLHAGPPHPAAPLAPAHAVDHLVFGPLDVDLSRSPMTGQLDAETYVLGAFNPGLLRLPGGNLLMMVRIAEALADPVDGGHVRSIRWDEGGYVLDAWPLDQVDTADPRKFLMRGGPWRAPRRHLQPHRRSGCRAFRTADA